MTFPPDIIEKVARAMDEKLWFHIDSVERFAVDGRETMASQKLISLNDAERILRIVTALNWSPPSAAVKEEREAAWLIERGDTSAPAYFSAGAGLGERDWTDDNLKALRFARKHDAEVFAASTTIAVFESAYEQKCRVAEHMWPNIRSRSALATGKGK